MVAEMREKPPRNKGSDVGYGSGEGAAMKVGMQPAGFEPATGGLEIRCSIQLSYGCGRIVVSSGSLSMRRLD